MTAADRYVAHQWDYVGHTWYVTDRQERLIGLADGLGQMTEAEAKIFIWAVEGIRLGHTLALVPAPLSKDVLGWYDGPTEGVAPAT